MKFDNLNERVLFAKESSEEMNDLIGEYIPFIRNTATRVIPSVEYDSYSSTAMEAFAEAVSKFRMNEGNFLGFASLVISNRIRDQIRKEYRPREIPGEEVEAVQISFDEADRSVEVGMFRAELAEYGITLNELLKNSPRHKNTRLKANLAAETLVNDSKLFELLKKTGRIPVKKLGECSGITCKLIEHRRKYIIARALLKQDKYSYLKEYVK
ncbi:MAG: sigma factor [Clostridia bacterium]